jgi:biotin carboxylase
MNCSNIQEFVLDIKPIIENCSHVLALQESLLLPFCAVFEAYWKRFSQASFQPPIGGIRRARLKPAARKAWNRAQVDDTRWFVSRCQTNDIRATLTGCHRFESIGKDKSYVVKPVAGAGSEAVHITSGSNLTLTIEKARSYIREYGTVNRGNRNINVDGTEYDLNEDILVEEYLEGPEFTVDGFIHNGEVSCVVQHKETRVQSTFIGDGLIVSPPDRTDGSRRISPADPTSALSPRSDAGDGSFCSFLRAGLRALEIDNWPFHAEVIQTVSGLRFVELNARPGGGLLWHTCGLHLGIDPFQFAVQLLTGNVKKRSLPASARLVTGQFPIYAHKQGIFKSMLGVDEARNHPAVARIDVVAQPGFEIKTLEKENYLAFVSLRGSNHAAIRAAWHTLSQLLVPVIRNPRKRDKAPHRA